METKHIKSLVLIFVMAFIMFCIPLDADAQCAMCSLSAEQNMKDGGTDGRGLNKGILFLLSLPYVLIGFIGYMWYKNRKTEDRTEL